MVATSTSQSGTRLDRPRNAATAGTQSSTERAHRPHQFLGRTRSIQRRAKFSRAIPLQAVQLGLSYATGPNIVGSPEKEC